MLTYEDKVLLHLKNNIKPGEKVMLSSLTENPADLIKTIKELIDTKCVDDIEFANDYTYVRKMWTINPLESDMIRLECITKDIEEKSKRNENKKSSCPWSKN